MKPSLIVAKHDWAVVTWIDILEAQHGAPSGKGLGLGKRAGLRLIASAQIATRRAEPDTECRRLLFDLLSLGSSEPLCLGIMNQLFRPKEDFGSVSNPDLNGAARRAELEAIERRRQVDALRRERAAAGAGDICSCAAGLVRSEHMVSYALYAGSLRVIAPGSVTNLSSSLRQARSQPQCRALEVRS